MRVRTEMVFEALRELGTATEQKISEHLDIPNADIKDRNKVSSRLRDLKDSGIAEECGEEGDLKLYRLAGRKRQRGSLQDRLWGAACLRARKGKNITASEGALLAGASREYAARCYRFWEDQGFLVRRGTESSRKFGTVPLFRVEPGKEKEAPPRWHRRAEEKKRRSTGGDARATVSTAAPGLPEEVSQALAGVVNFIKEARQILGEANVQVSAVLDEMDVTLERVARGELPKFHEGGIIDPAFLPRLDLRDTSGKAIITPRNIPPILVKEKKNGPKSGD